MKRKIQVISTIYKDIEEYNNNGFDYEDIEALSMDTTVIEFTGGIIVQEH